MLRAVQMWEAWLAKFQGGAKTLPWHLYEESVGVWSAGAEVSAGINKGH